MVYGIVGYKMYVKMMLVVCCEGVKFRCYVYFGIGNYYVGNVCLYFDYSLFICNEELVEDVYKIF